MDTLRGRVPMGGHDARGAGEVTMRGAGAVGAGAEAAVGTIGAGSEENGKQGGTDAAAVSRTYGTE
jgi:hypothetical protein